MGNDYNNEEYINNLADKFVETGEVSYKESLLKAFHPYFKKYVYIFCTTNTVDINNKDTITFLRLFMSNEDRSTPKSIMTAAKKTIAHLRMIFSDQDPADIYNEAVCIFLEQLARYKPMIADHTEHKARISFTHFVQVNTRYRLKTLSSAKSKDALHGVYNLEFNEDTMGDQANHITINDPISLDYEWVKGTTAGEIFNQLDEFERYLLFIKYENQQGKTLSDYELARVTGSCRMAIRRKLLKIKEKIKGLIDY